MCVQIVMEYCGVGSVSDLIGAMEVPLTEEQISIILAFSLQGLAYLHYERRSIHRVRIPDSKRTSICLKLFLLQDVKAGNILLTNDGCAKLGMQ